MASSRVNAWHLRQLTLEAKIIAVSFCLALALPPPRKAAKAIRTTIRQWRIVSSRTHQRLEDIARLVNPLVRGWLNYYGRFYRSACAQLLMRYFDQTLTAWARRKFKRLRGRKLASMRWLKRTKRRAPKLFAVWELAAQPQGWLIGAG